MAGKKDDEYMVADSVPTFKSFMELGDAMHSGMKPVAGHSAWLINRSVVDDPEVLLVADAQIIAFTHEAVEFLINNPRDAIEFGLSGETVEAAFRAIGEKYNNPTAELMFIARLPGISGSMWMRLPESARAEIDETIKPLQLL